MSLKITSSKKIHPESLLQIPMLHHAVEDLKKSDFLFDRAIDNRWFYNEVIAKPIAGFNPSSNKIFCGQNSKLKDWLPVAHKSARPLNVEDKLVREVLFFTHDYLHLWAYQLIQKLVPEMGFGISKVNEDNLEDFAFCHMVTEAVATVGLDYWMLCEKGVNDYCSIGSNMTSLTSPYSEKELKEYRQFNPDIVVQDPSFFKELTNFYCTGVYYGFDIDDLVCSPKILRWLEHELGYGEMQRLYTRRFLWSFIDSKQIPKRKSLQRPIEMDQPWQKKLIEEVGLRLWDKVKKNTFEPMKLNRQKSHWKRKAGEIGNFQYSNLNSFNGSIDDIEEYLCEKGFEESQYFLYQFISQFRFDDFKESEIAIISGIVARGHVKEALLFFSGKKKVESKKDEPSDLILPD